MTLVTLVPHGTKNSISISLTPRSTHPYCTNVIGYVIGKVTSPACQCHYNNETVQHYLLDCFLYTNERQLLFSQVNQLVTNFNTMPKYKKLDMLLFGIPDNEQYYINKDVAKFVQSFIIQMLLALPVCLSETAKSTG